jgi:hypothetical protein
MESILLFGIHNDRRVGLVHEQRRCQGECSYAGTRVAEYVWVSLGMRRRRARYWRRVRAPFDAPKSRTRRAAFASTPNNRCLLQFKRKPAFGTLLRFEMTLREHQSRSYSFNVLVMPKMATLSTLLITIIHALFTSVRSCQIGLVTCSFQPEKCNRATRTGAWHFRCEPDHPR